MNTTKNEIPAYTDTDLTEAIAARFNISHEDARGAWQEYQLLSGPSDLVAARAQDECDEVTLFTRTAAIAWGDDFEGQDVTDWRVADGSKIEAQMIEWVGDAINESDRDAD